MNQKYLHGLLQSTLHSQKQIFSNAPTMLQKHDPVHFLRVVSISLPLLLSPGCWMKNGAHSNVSLIQETEIAWHEIWAFCETCGLTLF